METRSIETAPGMVFDVSAEVGDGAPLPTNAATRPVLDPIRPIILVTVSIG
jgi:hypothetical protein